jgi:hypothetical protein
MEKIQNEISNRLKEVRTRHYETFKLSTAQFSKELEESEFNLQNYESGKASIPNRLLIALYYKGINPIYILTGEGDVYTDTPQGIARRNRVLKSISQTKVQSIAKLDISAMSIQELIDQATQYTAVAGDIMKLVQEKQRKIEDDANC